MKLINIGFGNIVFANRLIAIVSPESAPVKRLVQDARDRGMLIDATYGRRTRAVLITDSDHIILSAVQPETVANRLNTQDGEQMQAANGESNSDTNGESSGDSIGDSISDSDVDDAVETVNKAGETANKAGVTANDAVVPQRIQKAEKPGATGTRKRRGT